jgi:valyl-tRNA synthetase
MSSSQDVRFAEDKIAQGAQLANKLWNAARLILLGVGPDALARVAPRTVEDRWILSRLERAKSEVVRRIDTYDFSHAALALYDFVYGELCDWYLELVKPRLREREPELCSTLVHVLTQTLALAHPIIPFITEEIYGYVPGATGLLAGGIPQAEAPIDDGAEVSLGALIGAIQALRAWRDFAEVKAAATLPARLSADGYEDTREHLERMARLSFRSDGGDPVASVPVPGGAVELLASPDLDLGAAERKRSHRRAKLEREIDGLERKLGNSGFVEKAPPDVVERARADVERLRAEREALS